MKLTNKIVEDVIKEAVGEDSLPLVRVLKNKKNVSEFKIAESINMQINQTRNVLYRLYHANLVNFIRRKDKKKGWYIYYWTFNPKRIKYLLANIRTTNHERLTGRLEREKTSQFYACNTACIRINFEQAMDFNFKCPECGELMYLEDNKKKIAALEIEIKQIEKEIRVK